MAFTRATRKKVSFKMALTGPSGSGKTLGALLIAQGLGGGKNAKIAVIDSENDSASLYSDEVAFDACPISAPFTVQKYTDAIRDAVEGGYDVLVIDSLTHAWAGEGGLLSQKETLDARGGNQFTNWAGITKQQESFKSAFLQAPIHIIATMRSKQDYAVETGANGKSTPKKVGLAPIQREGMEYEFTTVLDVGINHEAFVSKDRTGLFDGVVGTLTPAHGKQIRDWLESGEVPPLAAESEPTAESASPPTKEQLDAAREVFIAAANKIGLPLKPGAECGKWANRALGRPDDSREKFSVADWYGAAQGIEQAFFNAEMKNQPTANRDTKNTMPSVITSPPVLPSEDDPIDPTTLTDPFGEDAPEQNALKGGM